MADKQKGLLWKWYQALQERDPERFSYTGLAEILGVDVALLWRYINAHRRVGRQHAGIFKKPLLARFVFEGDKRSGGKPFSLTFDEYRARTAPAYDEEANRKSQKARRAVRSAVRRPRKANKRAAPPALPKVQRANKAANNR